MRWILISLLMWVAGTPGAARAQVEVATPTPAPSDFQPEPWPEQFYQSAMTRVEALEYRLVNALFDGNTSFDVFNHNFSQIRTSTGVRMGRNIYNNYDVMNTWTVIDSLRINLSSQIWGASSSVPLFTPSPEQALQLPFAGVSLGVNGALELRDVRQMSPEHARSNRDLTAPDLIGEGDIQDLNPYLNSSPLDSPIRVKLKDILNPVKLPFRIPFNRKDVRRMKKGEIISYTLSGTVGFGANIGWNYDPIPLIQAGAGIGFEIHLAGNYQVAVMKEDDRFVKVRVSRIGSRGGSLNLNSGVRFENLYEGFFLFKGKSYQLHLANYSPSITPFHFSIDKNHDREVDLGYRYDLESPEGRDAFHRAVLGSWVRSEETASEDEGAANPAVSKLYRRTTVRSTGGAAINGNLNPILRFDFNRGNQEVNTEIELPDGTRQYFQTSRSRSNLFSFLGANNRLTHRTSVLIDEEAFQKKLEDSVLLTSENSIEDSYTFASSLNRYLERVEEDLGETGVFPKFPDRMPSAPDSKRQKRVFYGRSSFYFGMAFKLSGLRHFLNTPWKVLEERAGKLGIRLKEKYFQAAKDAFEDGDAEAESKALNSLFTNQHHSELYPRLLMEGLPESEYERFLVAQNPAFGNIQRRGHTPLAMENVLRTTSQSMGMSTDTDRTALDPEATIKSFSSTKGDDQRITIRFNLTKTPEFIYFRIQPMSRRHRKDVVEIIAFNRDQRFKAGENSFVLDPASTDPLVHKLSSRLDSGQTLFMTLGYSQKAANWGFGATQRFNTTDFYARPLTDE